MAPALGLFPLWWVRGPDGRAGTWVAQCERLVGRPMNISFHEPRKGDHVWWVTDNRRFELDYPDWKIQYSLRYIVEVLF